jgi:very-short-patch-repair endonuclease
MLRGTASAVGKARKLRRNLTLPEGLLWRELRKKQTGFKFRKQHPAGPFVLDFACLEARLAIEVDGEAHDRGSRPARDEARDEWLANQGFSTLRIPASDVLKDLGAVVAYILAQRQPLHRPAGGPPPRTGEELR